MLPSRPGVAGRAHRLLTLVGEPFRLGSFAFVRLVQPVKSGVAVTGFAAVAMGVEGAAGALVVVVTVAGMGWCKAG